MVQQNILVALRRGLPMEGVSRGDFRDHFCYNFSDNLWEICLLYC